MTQRETREQRADREPSLLDVLLSRMGGLRKDSLLGEISNRPSIVGNFASGGESEFGVNIPLSDILAELLGAPLSDFLRSNRTPVPVLPEAPPPPIDNSKEIGEAVRNVATINGEIRELVGQYNHIAHEYAQSTTEEDDRELKDQRSRIEAQIQAKNEQLKQIDPSLGWAINDRNSWYREYDFIEPEWNPAGLRDILSTKLSQNQSVSPQASQSILTELTGTYPGQELYGGLQSSRAGESGVTPYVPPPKEESSGSGGWFSDTFGDEIFDVSGILGTLFDMIGGGGEGEQPGSQFQVGAEVNKQSSGQGKQFEAPTNVLYDEVLLKAQENPETQETETSVQNIPLYEDVLEKWKKEQGYAL